MQPNIKTGPNKSLLQTNLTKAAEPYKPPPPITEEQLQAPAPTQAQLREQLRRVLAHVVTPEKLQTLVWSTYEKAKFGDKFAMEMIFDLLRGQREEPAAEQSIVKSLTKQEVEDELAKLGYAKPSNGITVEPPNGPTV